MIGGGLVLSVLWLLDFWRQSTPVSQARVSIRPQTPIVITASMYYLQAGTAQTLTIAEISGAAEVRVAPTADPNGATVVQKDWKIHVAAPTAQKVIKLTIVDAAGAEQAQLDVSGTSNVASNGIVMAPTVESAGKQGDYNVSWVTLKLHGAAGKFALLEK